MSKLLLLFLLTANLLFGQNKFNGKFLMSFNSAENAKNPPMLWYIEPVEKGGEMVMEIQDEMKKRGVSKRVLLNVKDSTWTMLMEYNLVKQGTRVQGAAMYRDTIKHRKFNTVSTKEIKTIEGFTCKKIIVESENYSAEVWVTDQINFDLCKVYRLLNHCGMMGEYVRKGDWFMAKKINKMVLEASSLNKATNEKYTMSISEINPGIIDTNLFNISGFKLSEIAEGQNCGVVIKEE